MSKTQERKDEILNLISTLFGDTNEDEADQADALEEIASLAQSNVECLREQIRDRAQ